jgi:hypothetical protein
VQYFDKAARSVWDLFDEFVKEWLASTVNLASQMIEVHYVYERETIVSYSTNPSSHYSHFS